MTTSTAWLPVTANGFEVRGLLENYLRDEADDGWATLIVWENPDYRPH